MTDLLRRGAALLLVLLIAACAEEEHGTVELAPATSFPVWMIRDIGPTGTLLPGFGIRGMGFGGPFLNAAPGLSKTPLTASLASRVAGWPGGELAARVLSSPTCLPDLVGDGIDTDGDGVPDDRTATYTVANCTVYDTASGDTYMVRGVYRLRDNNADRYGFDLTVTGLDIRTFDGGDGTYQSLRYINVAESSRLTATGGTYHFVLDGEGADGDFTGARARRLRYDLMMGYTPVGAVPVGGPLPDGAFTLGGDLDISIAEPIGAARVQLQLFTTQPMTYEDGCGGLGAGAFQLRLNGSTSEGLLVVFDNCNGEYEPIGAGVL